MTIYATSHEIALAVVLAHRLCDHLLPEEEMHGPEWIVTRGERIIKGETVRGPSRAAYYALDALIQVRPEACNDAILRGLGFGDREALRRLRKLRRGIEHRTWWDEKTAANIQFALAKKIIPSPHVTSLGARALHATSLQVPRRVPNGVRKLSPAEAAMNASLMGDPGAVSTRVASNQATRGETL